MTNQELPAFFNPYAFPIDSDVTFALMADAQIRRAIERGAFDDLAGSGQPLDLPERHDPEWWLNNLLRREGVHPPLPPSIQLRKDDAALDELLDRLFDEAAVRRTVEDFNQRVIGARYLAPQGPPLITMPRDVDATVAQWAQRKQRRSG